MSFQPLEQVNTVIKAFSRTEKSFRLFSPQSDRQTDIKAISLTSNRYQVPGKILKLVRKVVLGVEILMSTNATFMTLKIKFKRVGSNNLLPVF